MVCSFDYEVLGKGLIEQEQVDIWHVAGKCKQKGRMDFMGLSILMTVYEAAIILFQRLLSLMLVKEV
jgi:hypothetical protein